MITWWACLLWCLLAVIVGAVAGFFGARAFFKKQIRENPPINEKQIRAMFMSMGVKPSEAKIRAVMNSMKNSN